MNNRTQLEASERNGNLHIRIKGVYADNTPYQLVDYMQQNYRGAGNIFIHTDKVTEVAGTGGLEGNRQDILAQTNLNKNLIYLIGSKAMALHFPCNKIIIPPPRKARCTGCKKCTCANKESIRTTASRTN
jgi:hypothetical protein